MKHLTPLALALLCSVPAAWTLDAQLPADLSPFLSERAAEVALARSAAPKWVSDSATVLYLGRTGYVEAAHGTNGWTCLVVRNWQASLDDFTQWSLTNVRAPHCLNAIAGHTVLPEMTARAEWVMRGFAANVVASRIKEGYRTGRFKQPESGAMAYMMSHQQVLAGPDQDWMPHVMFYYPVGTTPAQFGARGMDAPVVGVTQDPIMGYILVVPVTQWSDGSANMEMAHQ